MSDPIVRKSDRIITNAWVYENGNLGKQKSVCQQRDLCYITTELENCFGACYRKPNEIELLGSRWSFGTSRASSSARSCCSSRTFRAGRTGGTSCTSWSYRPLGTGIAFQTLGTSESSWARQSVCHETVCHVRIVIEVMIQSLQD